MNNTRFIQTPVFGIFENAIRSTNALGERMGNYPIVEYILCSLFLKVSGAMEQKLHSIIIEVGNKDLDVRLSILNGEYKGSSSKDDKSRIYKELVRQVLLVSGESELNIDESEYWHKSIDEIKRIFSVSLFKTCNSREYEDFEDIVSSFQLTTCNVKLNTDGKPDKGLFSDAKKIAEIYTNHLYKTRNRLAHNSLVQQDNLPRIRHLSADKFRYNNFFLFFTIFVFIDKLFIDLFGRYNDSYNM